MTKPNKKSDLMLIPESILKKRHDLDEIVRKRAASEQHIKKVQKADGKSFYVKKPETFLARGRSRRNNATRLHRVAKKGMQKRASNEKQVATKELEGEDETVTYQSNSVGAPMVFCVRIRDDSGLPKCVKNILRSLRLKEQHQGVFLKYDEETRKQLHLVEPFVMYGPPSKAVVADLIERRGHGYVRHERVPLADNTVIELALGDHNIICKEDLVHELNTVGEAFQEASKFLDVFQLADAKTHFERKTLKVKDGKDYGDRGEAINDYIKEVL
jgi:large subunit ribosomal protein L7e